jgi:hypothetical protein
MERKIKADKARAAKDADHKSGRGFTLNQVAAVEQDSRIMSWGRFFIRYALLQPLS